MGLSLTMWHSLAQLCYPGKNKERRVYELAKAAVTKDHRQNGLNTEFFTILEAGSRWPRVGWFGFYGVFSPWLADGRLLDVSSHGLSAVCASLAFLGVAKFYLIRTPYLSLDLGPILSPEWFHLEALNIILSEKTFCPTRVIFENYGG